MTDSKVLTEPNFGVSNSKIDLSFQQWATDNSHTFSRDYGSLYLYLPSLRFIECNWHSVCFFFQLLLVSFDLNLINCFQHHTKNDVPNWIQEDENGKAFWLIMWSCSPTMSIQVPSQFTSKFFICINEMSGDFIVWVVCTYDLGNVLFYIWVNFGRYIAFRIELFYRISMHVCIYTLVFRCICILNVFNWSLS